MRRNCILIKEEEFRKVYIDENKFPSFKEVLDSDEKFKAKFAYRVEQISKGMTNKDVYEKLSGYDDLWEIRLFKQSKGRNHRIYCKQIETENAIIHIILIELFLKKKSKGIPKEIKIRLKEIQNYEYEI